MRFVRYNADSGPSWGVLDEDTIHSVGSLVTDVPMVERVGRSSFRAELRRAIDCGQLRTLDRDDVSLLAPVERPGQFICVGLNYHDHAEEQNETVPENPLLFGKSPSAVTNPGDPIVHPSGIDQVDYEVELAIVIGETARNVCVDEARKYVAGYTICNDVSARDAQFGDGQYFRGKSFETFAPLGPVLVAGDDFDPNAVDVACTVNGETKQSSNTSEFIFDVDEVISYISNVCTLRPGDVISTGTPGGVGIFRDPPELLEPGDMVAVTVDGIGSLENHVIAAD